MASTLHVEVLLKEGTLKTEDITKQVKIVIESFTNPVKEFCLHNHASIDIKESVEKVSLYSYTKNYKTCFREENQWERQYHEFSQDIASPFPVNNKFSYQYYAYTLHNDGPLNHRLQEIALADEDDTTSQHYLLPCRKFQDSWDTVVIDHSIKSRLLDYIKAAFLYEKKNVNGSVISWNRCILLYGPPGSGKTSLCQALAQKAAIRFGENFKAIHLIHLNGHNIFGRDSEGSTKLVNKTFEKIHDLAGDRTNLVFLQIDNVESLAPSRLSRGQQGSESGNIIRAMGCFFAQLDRVKKYANLLMFTTTDKADTLDDGFIDRADIKVCISYPAAELIYEIYAACLNELIRVGIVLSDNVLIPPTVSAIQNSHKSYETAQRILQISKFSVNLTGRRLKKMPFTAQARQVNHGETWAIDYFLDNMIKEIEAEKKGLGLSDIEFRSAVVQHQHLSGSEPQIVDEIENDQDTPSPVQIRPRSSSRSTGRGRTSSRAGKRRRGSSTRTTQRMREFESDDIEDVTNNGRRLRNTKVIPLVSTDEVDEEREDNDNPSPSPPSKKSKINRQVDLQNDKDLNLVPSKSHCNNNNNNNNSSFNVINSGNTLETTNMSSSLKTNLPKNVTSSLSTTTTTTVTDYSEARLRRLYRLRRCYIDLTKSTCTSEGVLVEFKLRNNKNKSIKNNKKVQDSIIIPTINLNQESNQVPLDLESTINTFKNESHHNSTSITFPSSSLTPPPPATSLSHLNETNSNRPPLKAPQFTKNVPSSQIESLSTFTSHNNNNNNNSSNSSSSNNNNNNNNVIKTLHNKLIESSTSLTSLKNTSNTVTTTVNSVSISTASSSSTTPSAKQTSKTTSPKSIPQNQQQLSSTKEVTKPVKHQTVSNISPSPTKIANNFIQSSSTTIITTSTTTSTTTPNTNTTTKNTTMPTNTTQQSSSTVLGDKLKLERFDPKIISNSLKLTPKTPNSKTLVDIKVEQTTSSSKNTYYNNTPKRTQNSNDVKPIISRLAVVGTPTSSSNRLAVTPNNCKTSESVGTPKRKQQFNVIHSTANTPVLITSRNKTPVLQSRKTENNNNRPVMNGFHPQISLKTVNPKMERRRTTTSHSSSSEDVEAEVITLDDSDNEGTPKKKRILDREDIKRAESVTITILPPGSTNGTPNQIGIVDSTCQICHIVFQNKRELTNHQRTSHENPSKVRCRKCKKAFMNDKNLDRHKDKCKMKGLPTPPPSPLPTVINGLSHPSPNQNSNDTNFNGKLTPNNKQLTSSTISIPKISVIGTSISHESISSSKKVSPSGKRQGHVFQSANHPFKCSLCSQSFTTEATLKFHVSESHDQIREQISCSVCGNLFASEAEVEEHEAASHRNLNSPLNESDGFPGTPFSQATTELSSVSSYNNSDCDPLALYNESPQYSNTPGSLMDEYEFSGTGFQNNGSLLRTNTSTEDLPMDRSYQNCQVCGECVFNNEMNQHCTLRHPNQQQQSLSTNNAVTTCHDEFVFDVPVPDVENIIEVETTDEFLTFLNAF